MTVTDARDDASNYVGDGQASGAPSAPDPRSSLPGVTDALSPVSSGRVPAGHPWLWGLSCLFLLPLGLDLTGSLDYFATADHTDPLFQVFAAKILSSCDEIVDGNDEQVVAIFASLKRKPS